MVGQKLIKIEETGNGDAGLKLTFDNGQTLEFAYSGDEGTMWVDGNEVHGVDIDELCGES